MNAVQDSAGVWQSHVHVRKRNDPELWEVIDRNPAAIKRHPDTRFGRDPHGRLYLGAPGKPVEREIRGGSFSLYTRIWAAITPKDGLQPGYCAVVGEVHEDGNFNPKLRDYVLLDEGVTMGDNPSLALHPDLFEATAALKDLYSLDRLYMNFKQEEFLTEIQKQQWGIAAYPPEDLMSRKDLEGAHPFFRSEDHLATPIEAPYAGNDEWDFSTVDALFARKRLKIHRGCETFRFGQYRTPHRALAMACSALMFWDWSEILREQEEHDGYESVEPDEEELTEEQEQEAEFLSFASMVSDDRGRTLIEEKRLEGYREMVGDLAQ